MANNEPPEPVCPVIVAYLEEVDRSRLRENLRLSPEDRIRKLQETVRFIFERRKAARLN